MIFLMELWNKLNMLVYQDFWGFECRGREVLIGGKKTPESLLITVKKKEVKIILMFITSFVYGKFFKCILFLLILKAILWDNFFFLAKEEANSVEKVMKNWHVKTPTKC